MRSVCDSQQWKMIDRLYPDFAAVPTYIHHGLVRDGIIRFKNNSMKHSAWVLLIKIYNLPPWLLTKKVFISLDVLIPGPKSPTSENIDVFLQPLVHDLLKLWAGIPAINMSSADGERRFTLRACLYGLSMIFLRMDFYLDSKLVDTKDVHGVVQRHVQSVQCF